MSSSGSGHAHHHLVGVVPEQLDRRERARPRRDALARPRRADRAAAARRSRAAPAGPTTSTSSTTPATRRGRRSCASTTYGARRSAQQRARAAAIACSMTRADVELGLAQAPNVTPSASANRNVASVSGSARESTARRPALLAPSASARCERVRPAELGQLGGDLLVALGERQHLVEHHRAPGPRRGSPRSCWTSAASTSSALPAPRSPAPAARSRTSHSRRTTSTSSRSLVPK